MRFILLILLLMVPRLLMAAAAPDIDRIKAVDNALTSVEEKKLNPKAWEEENADKPYIALLSEYDVKLNDDWSFQENYHSRVKIQKDAAKELGEWPIYYNKSREEIVDIKAFVETPDGKKYEATKIQDLQVYADSPMYSDMKVKVISLPQVNIGTVIDVQVTTKVSRREIPGQFWDDVVYPVIPTRYARHTYVFPANKPVAFHAYNNHVQPVIDKKEGVVTYSFIFQETGYTADEDFMPPLDEAAGVLSLSSMTDWKQVADWYRDLVHKNTVDDAEITAKVTELVKDKTTEQDKARSILEFVQDNFRYVSMSLGDHAVEPHPTVDVFRNRYGDCKDLALIVRQMLKLAGIDASFCLFSGEFDGDPQHSLPNPSVFSHAILELSLDGKKYFVDPQAKGFDFGQWPSDYDNAHVLVIDETSFRFDRIPWASEDMHAITSSSDITVAEDGSAIFDVRVQLPMEASQDFKQSWASTTNESKEKFFEGLEANFAQGGKMIEHQVKGLNNRYGPVEFTLKYESPTAYPVVNDMLLLKEAQQGDIPDFSAQKRKYPIYIPNNSLITNRNTYHIPDSLKVDFVPPDYAMKLDFVEVTGKYTKRENTVTVEGVYRMKRFSMPPERYNEVKSFRSEMYKKNDQYIVLKKKSMLPSEAKDWIKKQ